MKEMSKIVGRGAEQGSEGRCCASDESGGKRAAQEGHEECAVHVREGNHEHVARVQQQRREAVHVQLRQVVPAVYE